MTAPVRSEVLTMRHWIPPAALAVAGLAVWLAGCGGSGVVGGAQNPEDLAGVSIRAAALTDTVLEGASIRLSWNAPSRVPLEPQTRAGYVVGYEVYRSSIPQVPTIPQALIAFLEGGGSSVFIDTSAIQPPIENVTLTTDDTTGVVAVNRSAGSGTASIQYGSTSITYELTPTPPSAGDTYYYAIRVVTKKLPTIPFDPPNGTAAFGGTLWVSEPYSSGSVTALRRPVLVFPPTEPEPGSLDVDVATVQFTWESTPGADSYVIELSTDPTFPAGQTSRSTEYLVGSAQVQIARTYQGGDAATAYRDAEHVYWRVGARSSLDTFYPEDRLGRTTYFVFSGVRSFGGLDAPPGAP